MSNFKFKKRFGQNFLQDDTVIEKIARSISPKERDLIIEIGPGAGAVTKLLKKFNCPLIAFEIDEDTKKYLSPLEDDKTHVVYSDFLSIDLEEYLKNFDYDKLYIIGNLPYYITTPIVEHIIASGIPHESLTIMVQKEVAERFAATPGHREYGYMTVLLKYNYDIIKLTDVDRSKFYPRPNVDSTVIKLIRKNSPKIDYELFKTILKQSFQFKRKTIYNNLKKYDKILLEKLLARHGYNLSNRAEDLSLDFYIELTNELSKNEIEKREKENE